MQTVTLPVLREAYVFKMRGLCWSHSRRGCTSCEVRAGTQTCLPPNSLHTDSNVTVGWEERALQHEIPSDMQLTTWATKFGSGESKTNEKVGEVFLALQPADNPGPRSL